MNLSPGDKLGPTKSSRPSAKVESSLVLLPTPLWNKHRHRKWCRWKPSTAYNDL